MKQTLIAITIFIGIIGLLVLMAYNKSNEHGSNSYEYPIFLDTCSNRDSLLLPW
jgi:hypothetical protein